MSRPAIVGRVVGPDQLSASPLCSALGVSDLLGELPRGVRDLYEVAAQPLLEILFATTAARWVAAAPLLEAAETVAALATADQSTGGFTQGARRSPGASSRQYRKTVPWTISSCPAAIRQEARSVPPASASKARATGGVCPT